MNRIVGVVAMLICFGYHGQSQVVMDGFFEDWEGVSGAVSDPRNDDGPGLDILAVVVSDDVDRIYFRVDLKEEINIQSDRNLTFYIDMDNDPQTGELLRGIGIDLIYEIGDRSSSVVTAGGTRSSSFDATGFVSLPTVSSRTFEVSFKKQVVGLPSAQRIGQSFSYFIADNDGDDVVPDSGFETYICSDGPVMVTEATLVRSTSTDLRIVSYNSLFDGLFEAPGAAQVDIMVAIAPDIIAWQELYDATDSRLMSTLEPVTDEWSAVYVNTSTGVDVPIISRWPVRQAIAIDGNAAYVIDRGVDTLLVINTHFPCCDNDFERQQEVDKVMAFVRRAQAGETSLDLPEQVPLLIVGDMNLVGRARQYETLITGDIVSNTLFGDDVVPDYDGTSLADAVPKVLNTNLAYTWYNTNGSFGPGRLDFCLFTDSRLDLVNAFVYQSTGQVQPSDHLPVVADFRVKSLVTPAQRHIMPEDWSIHPSLADEYVWITTEDRDQYGYTITDMLGQIFVQGQVVGDPIRVSSLPAGQYAVNLLRNGQLVGVKTIAIVH